MKIRHMFAQVRAAQNLAAAVEHGRTPEQSDLTALGMPSSFKSRFKR